MLSGAVDSFDECHIGGHPFHTGWKLELETMVREVFIVLREGPYYGHFLVEMNILLRHLKQAFSIHRHCETSPRLSPPWLERVLLAGVV